MKISDLGEFGLIGRIQKLASRKTSSTLIGIGDDAAALKLSGDHILLATTDLLLEGVHFDLSYTDLYSLGWKSAAVNLSDIAAMGGVPRYCLTALGIPPRMSVEQISEFYRGFKTVLTNTKTALVGGDTCSSSDGLFVSVTALGEIEQQRAIRRAGARPGDRIFVTGMLGDSAAGLEILQNRKSGAGGKKAAFRNTRSAAAELVRRHLRPVPRVAEGRKIALAGCASSMIDLSDGLSSDLFHICKESSVGAQIIPDLIPVSPALRKYAAEQGRSVLDYAVSGGEDYELLFTVPASKLGKFRSLRINATEIGSILNGRMMTLADKQDKVRPLVPSGYDHFRKSPKSGPMRKNRNF